MKDYGAWLDDLTQAVTAASATALPEGITQGASPNTYEAQCRVCGDWTALICDLSEVPEEGYEHWCGRSPRCCP